MKVLKTMKKANHDKHVGATAELVGSAWLLGKGFDVFRNVSQHGLADVVAWDPVDGQLLLIDVKTCTKSKYKFSFSHVQLTDYQVDAGVQALVVYGTQCELLAKGVRGLTSSELLTRFAPDLLADAERSREAVAKNYVMHQGHKVRLIDLAKDRNHYSTLWKRIYTQGWSVEEALSTPIANRADAARIVGRRHTMHREPPDPAAYDRTIEE